MKKPEENKPYVEPGEIDTAADVAAKSMNIDRDHAMGNVTNSLLDGKYIRGHIGETELPRINLELEEFVYDLNPNKSKTLTQKEFEDLTSEYDYITEMKGIHDCSLEQAQKLKEELEAHGVERILEWSHTENGILSDAAYITGDNGFDPSYRERDLAIDLRTTIVEFQKETDMTLAQRQLEVDRIVSKVSKIISNANHSKKFDEIRIQQFILAHADPGSEVFKKAESFLEVDQTVDFLEGRTDVINYFLAHQNEMTEDPELIRHLKGI